MLFSAHQQVLDEAPGLRAWLAGTGVTRGDLAWGVAFFVLTLAASAALAIAVIVRMPADYFVAAPDLRSLGEARGLARVAAGAARNLLGLVLVVAGVLLSLPGVPGQGLLTIAVGALLLDFPGKPRLVARLGRSPRVMGALDRLRVRFGKEPFAVAKADADAH